MLLSFIHLISLQNGCPTGTSLKGATVHTGVGSPATRAMNADIAWRVTPVLGRYVPSSKPLLMSLSAIHLISLQNGWLIATSLKGGVGQAGSAGRVVIRPRSNAQLPISHQWSASR